MAKKIGSVALIIIFLMSVSCRTVDIHEFDEAGKYIAIDNNRVMVRLYETREAFKNPLKGFRPGWSIGDDLDISEQGYATVYRQNIKYSDLEMTSSDTVQKIIDWSNNTWQGIEDKNIKIIPRVVIHDPAGPDGGWYWPVDYPERDPVGQWTNEALKTRLYNFIIKLGGAWDNDPRVAAIELGLWGNWGEHHIHPLVLPDRSSTIPPDFQKAMGDAALIAFKNKKVMVRHPETFGAYDFGFYWDSFALPEENYIGHGLVRRDNWRNQMISGEVAYNWGNQFLLGGKPDATLRNNAAVDYLIGWIQRVHASSLGWIADYDKNNASLSKNAARMQKALGYRYVINSATYNKTIRPGDELAIELEISNVGSAPFYYQWPVELSLLNLQRDVVWKGTLDADIREWLPQETSLLTGKIVIPPTLENGNYIIGLSILDPSGNMPSIRFANTNYYNGGRTPLGIIGIGQEPEYYRLEPFDSLNGDNS
ncbi:MAG: DUF4832 domain-containing protein [Treponema sp.]|jgi:hypothetical protein|nr:DUF4832 domain-containing protein [Treponema sp.]